MARQAHVGLGIARIMYDCLREVVERTVQALRGPTIPFESSPQIKLVSQLLFWSRRSRRPGRLHDNALGSGLVPFGREGILARSAGGSARVSPAYRRREETRMSTVPPNLPPTGAVPPVPVPQKSSGNKILFWILGIIVGIILITFGSCAVIGFYAVHKAKPAGMDSDLMKKNPVYATAKMAASMSPDAELVSSDDSTGTIVVRDKKTGKTTTMKFDPDKKSMVVTDENGKTTTMTTTGDGANGGMEVKSSAGIMKIGANADKAPDWVPAYPGSSPQNTYSASNPNEQTGAFTFLTSDAPEKVISFYEDQLKSRGFTASKMTGTSEGKTGGMVSGQDKANNRTVVATIGTENDHTQVSVTFSAKH